MTYELALQLKNVGFRQGGDGYFRLPMAASTPPTYEAKIEDIEASNVKEEDIINLAYVPTLSELIEACGERFEAVAKNHAPNSGGWAATRKDKVGQLYYSTGTTPDEAVARLWLELNTK